MSKTYAECRRDGVPTQKITDKTKTIILTMVSCMCNNVNYIKLVRKDGEVKISHYNDRCSLAFSNLGAESNAKEMMKWAFEDNDFGEIIRLANSGSSAVAEVRIR
jgi:hypothetical protein